MVHIRISGRLLHLWQLFKVMPVLGTSIFANFSNLVFDDLNQATSSICQLWQILYSPTVAKSITSCQVAKNGTFGKSGNFKYLPNVAKSITSCQVAKNDIAKSGYISHSSQHNQIWQNLLLFIYCSILHLIVGFSFHFW